MGTQLKMNVTVRMVISAALVLGLCGTPPVMSAPAVKTGASKAPSRPSSAHHVPGNRHIRELRERSRSTYIHGRSVAGHAVVGRSGWVGHSHVPVRRGTIVGHVGNGNGAVAGALVRLAKPGGRRIKNPYARHATLTSSGGTFSMQMVKVGRYRVVASRAKMGRGHTPVRVAGAGVEHVNIKVGGAVKKPKRKK